MEHVPATHSALSDTRSVADESTSKRREVEKSEVGRWPKASRVKSVLASSSSMPVAVPLASPCASSLAADFPKQIERSVSPRKRGYLVKQNGDYMYRRLQSWTRRLARAERQTKQSLWFCELPNSPDGSVYAPSTNESDEDDFD